MPRPTKRDSKSYPTPEKMEGKRPSSRGGASMGSKKKKGFHVGPTHAPRNAYLGKAKKFKAELIMKSKIKQEYAKVLREEGMESQRLNPILKGKQKALDQNTEFHDQHDHDTSTLAPDSASRISKRSTTSSSNRTKSSKAEPNHKVRALSPQDIGPPMPQTSLRQLKKEAFAKYHPSRASGNGSNSGMGQGGKGRGQPNMGARMGMLLERIKREKAIA